MVEPSTILEKLSLKRDLSLMAVSRNCTSVHGLSEKMGFGDTGVKLDTTCLSRRVSLENQVAEVLILEPHGS